MMRIFITIEVAKVLNDMYGRKGKANESKKSKATWLLKDFPKEIKYESDSIIFVDDQFKDWSSFNIDKSNDIILYHNSSDDKWDGVLPKVVDAIKNTFNIYIGASHVLNKEYDKVFEIVFDDKLEKTNRIIKEVFKIFEAQQAFMQMVKDINLAYIMCLNQRKSDDIVTVIEKAKGEIKIVVNYLMSILAEMENAEDKSKLQNEIDKLNAIDSSKVKIEAATESEFKAIEKTLNLNQCN
jgi:hypothetical protein